MSDRGQEQHVKVGILKAQEIRVVFHSAYLLDGKPLVGEHCFTPTAEERLFVPAEKGASFTLKEVVIGMNLNNVFARRFASNGWVYSAICESYGHSNDNRYYQIGYVPSAGFTAMGFLTLRF